MPKEFKAFLISTAIVLFLMFLFNGSFEIADSPISVVIILIVFGLTYAWVKNEYFPDTKEKNEDDT